MILLDWLNRIILLIMKKLWANYSVMEKREEFTMPENVSLVKEKIYGNNKLLILRYEQE